MKYETPRVIELGSIADLTRDPGGKGGKGGGGGGGGKNTPNPPPGGIS